MLVCWLRGVALCGFGVFALVAPAWATWPASPAENLAICTEFADDQSPKLAPDGEGGLFILWEDHRVGINNDSYLQRVSPDGTPRWTTDGVVVSAFAGTQFLQAILPDGAGGAFVAWTDTRNDVSDIFLQRVDSTGARMWDTSGVRVVVQPRN